MFLSVRAGSLQIGHKPACIMYCPLPDTSFHSSLGGVVDEREKHSLYNPIGQSSISGMKVTSPEQDRDEVWAAWPSSHECSPCCDGEGTQTLVTWGAEPSLGSQGQQDQNWESNSGCQKPGGPGKIQEARCKAGQGKRLILNSLTVMRALENGIPFASQRTWQDQALSRLSTSLSLSLHLGQWKWSFLPPIVAMKTKGHLTSFLSLMFFCCLFRFYQVFSNLVETLTPS